MGLDRIVEPAGFLGISKAKQIKGDDVKAGFSEQRCRHPPDVHRRRVAVKQDDRRVGRVPKLLVMNASAVNTYKMRLVRVRYPMRYLFPTDRVSPGQELDGYCRPRGPADG